MSVILFVVGIIGFIGGITGLINAISKKKNLKMPIFFLVCGGIMVFWGIVAGISRDSNSANIVPASTPSPEIVKVAAGDIYSAYQANEIAADQQYRNKAVEISGSIIEISENKYGDPYVLLGDGGRYEFFGVQCFFSTTAEPELAKLAKGQKIVIQGECTGYNIDVIVENCSIAIVR